MAIEDHSDWISLRLPSDIQEKINRIAADSGHSRQWFIIRALRFYMLEEGGDILNVLEGRAQIERGEVHDMDEVMREIEDIVYGRAR